MISGFTIRGLLSIFFSRAMENLAAEINVDHPGAITVSDHGWWFSYFSNVPWLTEQCIFAHKSGHKIVLIGHSFGATAAIMVTQQLARQKIDVELLCPIDPAAQYPAALIIPPNARRVIGFFQKEPGQLGQGVDAEGKGWTDAEWKARAEEYQRYEGHLDIANDPYVHGKILKAVKEIT